MNSINLDTIAANSTLIDAKGSECPIPIIKLKSSLKKAADHTVFGVITTDKFAEPNMRDFCKSTGNEFLGVEHFDEHDIYYVKKRTIECQKCSNTRVVLMAVAAAGTLAYTAPQVFYSNPSAWVTFAFLAALASLPPLSMNLLRLVKQAIKKQVAPTQLNAAE